MLLSVAFIPKKGKRKIICVLFLIKLRLPKNKSMYDIVINVFSNGILKPTELFSSSEFSSLARLQAYIVATLIKTGEKSFRPPLDPINKSLGKIKTSKTKHNIMDGLRMSFVYFDFFGPQQ